jgi:hypothetical protein
MLTTERTASGILRQADAKVVVSPQSKPKAGSKNG